MEVNDSIMNLILNLIISYVGVYDECFFIVIIFVYVIIIVIVICGNLFVCFVILLNKCL